MSNLASPIDPELAKNLSAKSEQELFGILENPADWRPEVIDVARAELGRRSISQAQIDETLAEDEKRRIEQLGPMANEPLTLSESVSAALSAVGLGLLGLVFVWPQAHRFKARGYLLKSKRVWSVYWKAFGVRIVILISLVVYAALRNR
jgi:hypothetical protein